MPDPLLLLEDADLRRLFGSATVERGRDYYRRGYVQRHVSDANSAGALEIRGWVLGSAGAAYSTVVEVDGSLGVPRVHTACTCPVGAGCKHAVAVLLTVRRERSGSAGERSGAAWERRLGALLDELDDRDEQTRSRSGGPTPLGLSVELARPTAASLRGALRLRPVQRGARGGWVRSGISWQTLQHPGGRPGHDPRQARLLAELLVSYRTASRQTYLGAESHVPLRSFGPGVWGQLRQLRDAGVPLVPAGDLDEVLLAESMAGLQFDVQRDRGTAALRLVARLEAERYEVESFDVLGDAGHGLALWRSGQSGRGWSLTLAELDRPVDAPLRRLVAAGGHIVVPQAAEADLVGDYLPRLARHVPVVSSDGSVPVPTSAPPRLALTVTWVAVDEVRLRWTWRYRVGEDDRGYGLSETRGLRGVRRPEEERALLEALDLDEDQVHHLCLDRRRARGLREEATYRDAAAVAVATEVLPPLEKSGEVEIEEVGARPDYQEARSAPIVHFDAVQGADEAHAGRTDWLDLEVVISVDGQPLALARLLEALTKGQERVVLRSGLHVRVDRPEFARLAGLVAAAGELEEQPSEGVRLARRDLGLWDELAEIGLVDAQAEAWVQAARALRELTTLPAVDPVGTTAELRPYQLAGFRWLAFLWQTGLGGILADDMGLGKTLQTLALVAHARGRGSAPFLVVAPTSVVSAWAAEAAAFTPGLVVRTVTESHSRRGSPLAAVADGADVVVTSYTLYRLEVDDYVELAWGGLVLDEAQTVKNHQGKTYQAVRRLDVSFRLAVSGTPMENRLMELWALLSIVAPGLYPWPRRFAETVAVPVERLGDRETLDRFRRRIRPFLLRRTKELVAADLPPKQEQVLEVALTSRHRTIYQTHLQRERQTVLGLVEDLDQHRIAIFRSLTRLRQLSLDAALLDPDYDSVGSAKTDVLVDHLLELQAEGHRALVFSQFTSFLRRVRSRLEREGVTTAYLDGSTRRRSEVVQRFRAGGSTAFLISLKAGGVGLTLTEADYCFVLDPWWNPAVEAQAVDRAHRIGQQRPVNVYRLVARDTVEEKVMELKARKAALFSQVVGGDGLTAGGLDAQDVRALFAD